MTNNNELFVQAFKKPLEFHKNDKQKYKEIFLAMSYLNSYNEEFKEKVLNNIIENGIEVLSNYEIDMIESCKNLALFPYSGNKIKFKDEMNQMYEYAHTDKVDTIIDTFLGAGGSISSMYQTFLDKGIKSLILNDFNHTIMNVHKNVAENTDELIDTLINTYRTIQMMGDDVFNPGEETNLKLRKAFFVLEKNKDFEHSQNSALFLYFQNIKFSGAYDGKFEDGKDFLHTKASIRIYDINRYFQGLLNSVVKIKMYSKIYNSFDTVFTNDDYANLVDKFRGREEVLFLFDPPYYESSANYGLKPSDFNQRKLLEKLEGLNFLYNNNKHREIFEFIEKYKFHSMSKLRRNNSSRGSDVPIYEYLVSSNSQNINPVQLVIT